MNIDSLYHLLPTRLHLRVLLLGFVLAGGLLAGTSKVLAEPSSSTSEPAAQQSLVVTRNLFEELFENRTPQAESNTVQTEASQAGVFRLPEALREALKQAAVSLAGDRRTATDGGGKQ